MHECLVLPVCHLAHACLRQLHQLLGHVLLVALHALTLVQRN